MLHVAKNGSIFCLHDGRETAASPDIRSTIDAVEAAIPRLKDRGFQFVTLTEMFSEHPKT